MSMTSNPGLYIDENAAFSGRRNLEVPTPEDGELLIETHFSGVNPGDIKHGLQLGIYPAVLGYDFCGKVLEASSSSTFLPGDIVAGYTPTGVGRLAKYGTHQRYMVCPEDMAFSVPSTVPPEHAACLSVVASTAADALYNILKLPLPQNRGAPNSESQVHGPLLIWGASSSVGICALQLAKASGVFPIFVTASPERHPLLLDLGATCCFDYKSPNVVGEIKTALQKAQCGLVRYGFDAIASLEGEGSGKLLSDCASQDAVLASVLFQKDPRYKLAFAIRNRDLTFHLKGAPNTVMMPARLADHQTAWNVLLWAVEHYNNGFRIPAVDVFQGSAEEALAQLERVAYHGRGFGKLVLQHPLY